MFAIGFLSLLSLGFVAMSMGGDDDMSDAEQVEDIQDESPDDQETDLIDSIPGVAQDQPDVSEGSAEQTDPEDMTSEMVMNNISALFQDSGLDAEFPGDFIAFIEGLEGSPQEDAINDLAQFLESQFGNIEIPDEVVSLVDELQQTAPGAVLGKIADFVQERGDAYGPTDDVVGFLNELQGVLSDELIVSIVDLADALIVALEQNDPTTGSTGAETDQEAASEQTDTAEDQKARPPIGDQYRDPLKLAEERDAQRIEEVIASEEAGQPANLVTVSDASGTEIADELVLAERGAGADGTDPAYTVTAPEGENQITVGYDAEHTFQINYNTGTTSVTAGLNSIIEGPQGQVSSEQWTDFDEDGNAVKTKVWTQVFSSSTDIEIDVTQDQIGAHTAQIDLTNPDDTLRFNIADNVTGNLHLVFEESDIGSTDADGTTKRAYVIQTPADVTTLSSSQIADLISQQPTQTNGMSILAEIYLGEDSVFVNNSTTAETQEIRITNFINDNPQISANIQWASVVDF